MQVSAEQLGSLNVVPAVKLLVHGVSGVSGAAHGKKENVLSGGLLEGQSYGNAIEGQRCSKLQGKISITRFKTG